MSFTASPNYELPLEQADLGDTIAGGAMISEERSKWIPLFMLFPLAAATVSALGDGIPILTDFAFVGLTVICLIFMISEFRAFSFRWGIGGLLIFGGSLIWFCQDYLTNWTGEFSALGVREVNGITTETVARAGAHLILFLTFMILGTRIQLGGKVERFIARFPEPGNDRIYIALFLGMYGFGLIPYIFFTREGPLVAMWNDFMGGRVAGAMWTVGRDGNVNFSYGAYLAQVLQVGQMGSLLAAFYAVFIARSWGGRLLGLVIWLPSAALGFGGGTRGALVAMMLPLIGFVFIKFQSIAAMRMRRVSFKGYAIFGSLLLFTLLLVQLQATFRNVGFREADFSQAVEQKIGGNSMFSESLKGFYLIPRYTEPFYTKFPGQGLIMPIPDTLYWFVVTPIPRAIWNSKPIDPVWQWYNYVFAGTEGTEGTTISQGGVGYWYFRYGLWGTIQGGLIMGFMIGMTERLLRFYAPQKPILILVSLAFATFLFRCFRGLQWVEFHGTLVGLVALAVLVYVARIFLGGGEGTSYGHGVEVEQR